MADITMPRLGETATEGTITRWFRAVGDQVEKDDVLFEVSTDKVDSEVPSSVSGYLAEILVPEGETVDVGVRLAVISDQPPSSAGDAPVPDTADAVADGRGAQHEAEPRPAVGARAASGSQGSDERAPVGGTEASTGVMSPLVRRLITENDLVADEIPATGRGGRLTRHDVVSHLEKAGRHRPVPAAPREAKPDPPARPTSAVAGPEAGDEVVPFSNIRRRTAEHMVRSQATSAHVLTAVEVDYENVEKVRRSIKDRFKRAEGFSLTYLPFVSRAVIDAIGDFPHVNASVGDDELIVHRRVHLGFAVDLSFAGLIVPVVHDADAKRLRAIAREVADLAARARAKKLTSDEIAGGTFTITNPGSSGTLITAPVINQPQVAILSTDGIRKRPVVVTLPDGSDVIVIHPVGTLAMSFDHRAFDGAYAAAFLARCRELLETRDWSQEI